MKIDMIISSYSDSKVTLKQLIIDEDNHAYDEARWLLLQWVLGFDAGFLPAIRETLLPRQMEKIGIIAFALHFLLMVGMPHSKIT